MREYRRASVYKLQRLRCRLCDAIFTAPLPAGVAALPKYDASCASMIELLRYGSGIPHFRIEGLQASLYVPAPGAVFNELIYQAAQAPLLHNDDTPMRVLSLMAERARAEAAGIKPQAKAISTTGIVAVLQTHKVVLFFTGHDHAGPVGADRLAKVLAHRSRELAPPMQMCDALAANIAPEFATVVGNCLAHGRRGVVEVVLDNLQRWMTEQFEQHLVEPNSGLGKALKRAILHRKGSMFYKTANSAAVGDIHMSVIHTCRLCDVNPFEYLQALQHNAPAVIAEAALTPSRFRIGASSVLADIEAVLAGVPGAAPATAGASGAPGVSDVY